jgi:hypothetical protein
MSYATKNVELNQLDEYIKVILNKGSTILKQHITNYDR